MKRNVLVFFILLGYCLAAQTKSTTSKSDKYILLKGKIEDSNKDALIHSNVLIQNTRSEIFFGTSTDVNGKFSLQLPVGTYQFTVSMLGYANYTHTYTCLKDTVLPTIILKETVQQLDEVVVQTNVQKNIDHRATGMMFTPKNDSLYKNLSVSQILNHLPGVYIDENNNVTLDGVEAQIQLNGKNQRLSKDLLFMLMESFTGDQIKNIELVQTPSAKYSGRVQKIIDINLNKQRDNGLLGSAGLLGGNNTFNLRPHFSINYKHNKFILSLSSSPYSFFKRNTKTLTDRSVLDSNLSFKEEHKRAYKKLGNSGNFGIDYTINDKHSIWAGISLSLDDSNTDADYTNKKYEATNLSEIQLNINDGTDKSNSINADVAYRYDISERGTRIDAAVEIAKNTNENTLLNAFRKLDDANTIVENKSNRDQQTYTNTSFSAKIDYKLPFKNKLNYFEAGLKYDNFQIDDENVFESYNATDDDFLIDPNFSNAFDYSEKTFAAYTSVNSQLKRFKYSFGLRLEQVNRQSYSKTLNQTFNKSTNNILPVLVFKYMLGKKEQNNISLSYRRGYELPPYFQLNPFETYINSNTIKKGNPELDQNIFDLFSLGLTLKDKYFFTLSTNFYSNLTEVTELLEGDITYISYRSLGKRRLTRFSFESNFTPTKWWRLHVNPIFTYSYLNTSLISNEFFGYNVSINNTFTLPEKFIISFLNSFANGQSIGYDKPNTTIRAYSSVQLSKRMLKNKLNFTFSILDVFGSNNNESSTYILDNTRIKTRTITQQPNFNFSISYRFSSGSKINKKSKKSTGVDSSRL